MLGYKAETGKNANEMTRIILEDLSETGFIRFVPYKEYREIEDKIVPIPRLRLLMVAKNEQERQMIKALNNSHEEEESAFEVKEAAAPDKIAVGQFHF